jgi:hypothetical protein
MDWPQVTDDFVKIGLPSICTAIVALFAATCTSAVALLISKSTRSHDLEKERRRRRQDALEKVSDDFQAACFRLSDLAMKYSAYRELKADPAGHIAIAELFESGGAIDAATKDLHLIAGRLKLLGLKKCQEAFVEFLNQTIAFRKILKLPPEPMATKDMVREKFDKVKVLQCAVEGSLAEAFESL